jgi:hypothetical protein
MYMQESLEHNDGICICEMESFYLYLCLLSTKALTVCVHPSVHVMFPSLYCCKFSALDNEGFRAFACLFANTVAQAWAAVSFRYFFFVGIPLKS